MNKAFGTVSQTIEALKKEGYTLDFNLQQSCIACHQTQKILSPDDFEIDEIFRFEGESNPDDEAVVYAISSLTFGVKGVLLHAYGPYADELSTAMVQKLRRRIERIY
ncbi:MAG: phosphoribosylpyrophosphate synthetase [Flavisolibacter sp.]